MEGGYKKILQQEDFCLHVYIQNCVIQQNQLFLQDKLAILIDWIQDNTSMNEVFPDTLY